MDMMDSDVGMKKEVLAEILDLMTKLGYDKMKKPSAMKIEMSSEEPAEKEVELEMPSMVEKSEDVEMKDDSEDIKKRLMSRFGK